MHVEFGKHQMLFHCLLSMLRILHPVDKLFSLPLSAIHIWEFIIKLVGDGHILITLTFNKQYYSRKHNYLHMQGNSEGGARAPPHFQILILGIVTMLK